LTIEERIQAGRRGDDVLYELICGWDYFVRYISLPYNIGGAVTTNEDGTYNIYLNSRHWPEQQQRSLMHELVHAEGGHLDYWKDLPEEVKEWEAENLQGKIGWLAS